MAVNERANELAKLVVGELAGVTLGDLWRLVTGELHRRVQIVAVAQPVDDRGVARAVKLKSLSRGTFRLSRRKIEATPP
ncbi:MAG TPA: hypothetical protein VGS01_16615 [Candidatus Limnocylindria bacterium]|jgi:hypothetical protein|nr:hypothetical protein [Candidatus Limnocylindria bacterium]